MKCVGGHDGVQHRGLDCGDGERWEAVGMGADGSKGEGMEGEGSRMRCASVGWWQQQQVPIGQDTGALHLTCCAALHSDVGCRQLLGRDPECSHRDGKSKPSLGHRGSLQ